VLLVNLFAALNFAKNVLENKKNVKTVKNVTKIKNKRKKRFYIYVVKYLSLGRGPYISPKTLFTPLPAALFKLVQTLPNRGP